MIYHIKKYFPFIAAVTSIIIFTCAHAYYVGNMQIFPLMRYCMGYFFLIFGFLKLVDLKGFAQLFQRYDFLAMHVPLYAYAYPFVELTLAGAYLCAIKPIITNSITCLIMGIGIISVWQALKEKKKITCACMGSVIQLPMTWLTLFENTTMFVMALCMLIFYMVF